MQSEQDYAGGCRVTLQHNTKEACNGNAAHSQRFYVHDLFGCDGYPESIWPVRAMHEDATAADFF
jgi:hypothetical protein